MTNDKIPQNPDTLRGFLLAAYKVIVDNTKALKRTSIVLISYLLLFVITPPILILLAFLTSPTQTAKFFNFALTADSRVLGESTANVDQTKMVSTYVAALLEPQAAATVQALRIVSPQTVADVALPTEVITPAAPGKDGEKGEPGPQGPPGTPGVTNTAEVGELLTGTGLTGTITNADLTLSLDTNVPIKTENDTNVKGAIKSNVLTLSWSDELSPERGGTGLSSTPANGHLLIGDGLGYTLAGLTGGANISVSNGSGSITIATSSTPTFSTVNGLTFTANATGFSVAGGTVSKTLAVTNSLTFGGTDGTTFTLPAESDNLAGLTTAQTLTNKTISASTNTILDITNSNLSGSAGITNANLANSALTLTAGLGLTGGGSISLGSTAALNIGAGNGILAGADSISVVLTTTGTTELTSSNSGLEISGSGLALLRGCEDDQILKWTQSGGWACAPDMGTADIQSAAVYAAADTPIIIGSSQVLVASVSVTPATDIGDIYIRAKAQIVSGSITNQVLTLSIEDDATCTGTTLASNTVTIAENTFTIIGDFELLATEVNPGTTAQAYSFCASTTAGTSAARLPQMFATVIN